MLPLATFGPLHSPRLTLRPWNDGDVPTMHAMCQDPDIRVWSGMPDSFDLDAVATYINVTLPAQIATGTGIAFAIVENDSARVAGSVGLYGACERNSRTPAQASVREWIGLDFRKGGYASEALDLLVRGAFRDLGLERITAYALGGNEVSRRLTERVGFRGRHVLRSAVMHQGVPWDIWYSDLLPTDPASADDRPADW